MMSTFLCLVSLFFFCETEVLAVDNVDDGGDDGDNDKGKDVYVSVFLSVRQKLSLYR